MNHSLAARQRIALIPLLAEYEYRHKQRAVDYLFPANGPLGRAKYQKHLAFFDAGAHYRTRVFMAAHRIGKTMASAFETTLHLTGLYPSWWTGRRFTHAVHWWTAGRTGKTTRDILQKTFLGDIHELGTGMIPESALLGIKAKAGIADAVEIVRVAHISGQQSFLVFKSYDQGRVAFEGTAQDGIDLDEEPPLDINAQCTLRTMTTGGMVKLTFTPLLGYSETVLHYLPSGQIPPDGPLNDSTYFINATWDDAPHLTASMKEEILAALPPYLRDAASRGIPLLRAGAVYPLPEKDFMVDDFAIPSHWLRAYGMDVGWQRTAVVWGAYDRETDTWTLYHEYYVSEEQPIVHAASIRARGAWIPGVIDPAARARSSHDGEVLLNRYQELGLFLEPANNAVESGLYEVWERLSTGRLKIFQSLVNWRREYGLYRRNDHGHILKIDDHLMDATRYLLMSGSAVARAAPSKKPPQDSYAPLRGSWMG